MNITSKIIMSVLFAFFFLPLCAQEFKAKKISTEKYLEFFAVDKDTKLRNGAYLKIDRNTRDTLISGEYRNDLKIGIWKYNSIGSQPWIAYDYDKNKITQISDQISKIDSFMIKKDDVFVSEKVDSPPVYLGFKDEIKYFLAMNIKIPLKVMEKGKPIISIASFEIDTSGQMKKFEIAETLSRELDTNIKNVLKKMEGEWSPAIFNGQPVDAIVFIVFDIKYQGTQSTIPKISNSIVAQFEYYGVQRSVKTTTTKTEVVSEPNRR